MDAFIEALAGMYLTRGRTVFISPQFNIPWENDAGQGGACPDFVALDFDKLEYLVVEVTTGSNLQDLFTKIRNRNIHWFPPIKRHLEKSKAIDERWRPRFLGLVRKDLILKARQDFVADDDVSFYEIEDAILEYAYSVKREKGLPRVSNRES